MSYLKPPIKEAVFDIRIDNLNITDVSDLRQIKNYCTNIFPLETTLNYISGSLKISENLPSFQKEFGGIEGYIFKSTDDNLQIQIRTDGITLNVINHYESWDHYYSLFIKLWSDYARLFNPSNIIRVATRYINRIELKLPFDSFQSYITYIPNIPEFLPQSFKNFFLQVHVPHFDPQKNIIITETIESRINNILPFILDIDVFQDTNLSTDVSKLELIFKDIRIIKNTIFENCITEKTRELFV